MVKKTQVSKELSAFFSKAGKISSANMSPEERKERAKKAANAMWTKRRAAEKEEKKKR